VPWATTWIAVGSLAAVAALILSVMVRILTHVTRQNDRQIQLQTEQQERDDMFKTDWYGKPARPGVPPTPGVMERLAKIENNTSSLPDRVTKLEVGLDASLKVHELLTDRQNLLQARHEHLERRVDDHLRVNDSGGKGE
jgi:Tfp pilus assembly protein PilN